MLGPISMSLLVTGRRGTWFLRVVLKSVSALSCDNQDIVQGRIIVLPDTAAILSTTRIATK